ncbi:MAG TPA: winged helix-turn-helix domain-containing protein [Anaerolineales bacterium]|nr:winged helix-turn-helix domain-containing protein [Anaerolineales bacterium]
MAADSLPFVSIAEPLLDDLAAGRCASVVGLSNTGKSTLMRALSSEAAARRYRDRRGRPIRLVLVDCNRAVALSAQAFYEVVVRSVLETFPSEVAEALPASLRMHHEGITDADSSFAASLSFNLALNELCEELGGDLALLLDEFDEVYVALDDRALLNLRALYDRFSERLTFVTATTRNLRELRGRDVEDEFAELFVQSTHHMPPLTEGEAAAALDRLLPPGAPEALRRACQDLAGGHPGLLEAVAQSAAGLTPEELRAKASLLPQVRIECLKIWGQLSAEEQEALTSLAASGGAGLAPGALARLEAVGVARAGRIFSPLLSDFASRRLRGAQAERTGVQLDVDSGDVWVDGVRVPLLTDLEFRLLRLLDERRDKLTDKYAIVTTVWGENYLGEVDDARIEKLVSRLRAKIEVDPAEPRYLLTQRGRGYKLTSQPRPETE